MHLLKKYKTPFGTIRILQEEDDTILFYQNGCYHSQSTPRGVSVCAYVHVAQQIILQKKAKNVLIIGCGGGTLATMLRRRKVQVTIVDINPITFTIARDYFRMPKDVVCVEHDGIAYVHNTKERFDAVVIDVFDANNTVPRGFRTNSFFGAVKKILSRSGVLVMNVILKNAKDRRAYTVAKNLKAAGMTTHMYQWSQRKDSNSMVVGGAVKGVSIPSGREPSDIREELSAVKRRKM